MDLQHSLENIDDSEELGQWTQVKNSLSVLDSYYDEIALEGMISRDQAKALVSECGVSLGGHYPPASFTVLPSLTGYKVAMEGMIGESARLLWELIKKAAALLLKVIRWVIEVIRRHRTNARDLQRITQNTTTIKDLNYELRSTLSTAMATASGVEEVIEAKKELEEANLRYDDLYTELVNDLVMGVSRGFNACMRDLALEMSEMADLVSAKLRLFEKALMNNTSSPGSNTTMIMLSELKTVGTPIPTNRLVQGLRAFEGIPTELPDTVAGVIQTLYDHMQSLRHASNTQRVEPVNALISINAIPAATAPYLIKPERDLATMQTIGHYLERLEKVQPSDAASPETRRAFTTAINCVTSEVSALRTFMAMIRTCEFVRDEFFDALFKVEIQEFLVYREVAKVSQDQRVVEAVNEAQRKLADKVHNK